MAGTGVRRQVLYERDAEIASLRRALADVAAGQGRALLIEGSPGVGKTELVAELCRLADGTARVLRGRGGEQERTVQLLVTRELFTPLVRAATDADLDRWFAGAAGLAGPLAGRGSTTAADSDFALVHAVYWLVANLADDGPVVIVIDDLHWVDTTTQRWIAYLLPRVAELPILLAMTTRPRELPPDSAAALGLAAQPDLEVIRPRPLGATASSRLLEDALATPDPEFCRAAHTATRGNPLLLRRLVTAVADAQIAPDAEAAQRLDRLGALSIRHIVLPRLHALGPQATGLTRAVAVLGDGCALADAARVAALPPTRAAAELDALVATEILSADPDPAFTHPLVRAAVLGELAEGSRRLLRLGAARVLHERGAAPATVAAHLAATDPVGEPWAVEVLRKAAAEAAADGSPAAAIGHLVTALREPLDPGLRFALLLDAGWQAFRSGDPRGGAWLEEALALAPDPSDAVVAWVALMNWRQVLKVDGDRTDLHLLPAELDDRLALTVHGLFLNDFGFTGANLRARVDRDREVAPDIADAVPFWWAGLAIDEVMTARSADAARRHARRARPDQMLSAMASDSATLAWVLVSLLAVGDLEEYERLTRAALDDALRRGSLLSGEWYSVMVAIGQLHRGEIAAAESTMVTWLDHSPDPIVPVTLPSVVATMVWIDLERHRPAAARATLDRFSLLGREVPHDPHGAFLLVQRGRLHQLEGDLASALGDYEEAAATLDTFGCRDSAWILWRPGAASCLAALGRRDQARALAEEQLQVARRFGAAPLTGIALRTLGAVRQDETGIAMLEQAVEILGRAGARGEQTSALLELGRLHRLQRRPSVARGHLETALDRAHRAGAVLLAGQIEDELHMCGARPRRRAVTGVQALTPAELRVVTLAAEGLSNPQVAQRLFITRKTVEKHLGAAFGKLQVSARSELAAALEQ